MQYNDYGTVYISGGFFRPHSRVHTDINITQSVNVWLCLSPCGVQGNVCVAHILLDVCDWPSLLSSAVICSDV